MEKFIITQDTLKKVHRFGLTGRTLNFKIKPVPVNEDPIEWIKETIEQIVQKCVEGLMWSDKVGFTFCSKDFARGDAWLNFRNASEVTLEDVWDLISKVYQSNSSGLSTETFCLGVTTVKMPTGRGTRTIKYNSFEEECRARKGIVTINNNDNLCLPRAVVVAKANIDKDPDYRRVLKDTGKEQTSRALQLLRVSGVTIPKEGAGIPELKQLQTHLSEYTITVYKYGNKGRDIVYQGSGGSLRLNLLYHKGHYNVITSLTAAFVCNFFCEECHVPYDHKHKHRCGGICLDCQQSPKCLGNVRRVKCGDCYRSFRGQACYENHKKPYGKSICDTVRRCNTCYKTVKTARHHTCGEIYCKNCSSHVPSEHLCYIQCDTKSPPFKDTLFIFYDLETRQEKKTSEGLVHEPTLCVFEQCCDQCMASNDRFCENCGVRQHILKIEPVERFMEYVLGLRKKFKKVVVIGHNAGGFDHQFLLNHILMKTDLTPELLMRGTKLILMSAGNVKFLDSLNYFPMALAKLPAAFGLTEVRKGYFPHLFNTLKNENYIGPLPSVEFYDPDNMKAEERQKFLKWHAELTMEKYEFNFQKEIVDYCVSDVQILLAACLKFRSLMLESGNVCPFTEATTIASACNKIFRRNFLKPNTIAIIPKNGYRFRDNQSKIAVEWLLWEEKQRNIDIKHTAKQNEARVCGVKVDGYCSETRQVFEFHGCYYHGCPRCYLYGRNDICCDNPSATMETRYEDTIAKTERLRALGFQVVEMWECDFRRNRNSEISAYTENHPLLKHLPLNPRDAFYGGRTGASKAYYKVKDGEKIKYVDVCSLYPWTNKYGKYPIGHPEIVVGNDCLNLDLNKTDGLIKCRILPPQNLYHPVLPVKMNNKLMFCLCQTCSETLQTSECNHMDKERALTGTWVIDEVLKAIEMGYKIEEIYEVWRYRIDLYNPETRTGGLFVNFINKFLKIKQEASDWPSNCITQEERNAYIEAYLNSEGIQLECAQIVNNPGLRALAKLCLNSFWGKFGQRENQARTKIVNKSEEFFNMLTNPAISVNTIHIVNENTLIVNWEYKEEAFDQLMTVNVTIAAYTTAQARLKLYSYLEKLNRRVLYYDTDSVIYISRPDEYDVPVGSFLGEMTDELSGEYIDEFVSGGPKVYSFRQQPSGKETIKVKGICINSSAERSVNFQKLRDMILKEEPPVYITSKNIKRTQDHEVITRVESKIFRPNFKKRILDANYDSVPYGYI